MRLLQDKSDWKPVNLGGKKKEITGTIFRHERCRLPLTVNQVNALPMVSFMQTCLRFSHVYQFLALQIDMEAKQKLKYFWWQFTGSYFPIFRLLSKQNSLD